MGYHIAYFHHKEVFAVLEKIYAVQVALLCIHSRVVSVQLNAPRPDYLFDTGPATFEAGHALGVLYFAPAVCWLPKMIEPPS